MFLKKHPFISVNILTIVFLIIAKPWSLELAALSFVVSLVVLVIAMRKKKEEENAMKMETKRRLLLNFIGQMRKSRSLPIIKTNLFLNEGEQAILQELSNFSETRSVTQNTGGGLGFRVSKRVYLRSYQGRSESHKEWRQIDNGQLVLTNKKLVFTGMKESRNILLKDIVSVIVFNNSIEVVSEKRSKALVFSVESPFIWHKAISIIRTEKDPFNLEPFKIEKEQTENEESPAQAPSTKKAEGLSSRRLFK